MGAVVRRVLRGQKGTSATRTDHSPPVETHRKLETSIPDGASFALKAIAGPKTRNTKPAGQSFAGVVSLLTGRSSNQQSRFDKATATFWTAQRQKRPAAELMPLLQDVCDHADFAQSATEVIRCFDAVAWPDGTPLAVRYPLAYFEHLLESDLEAFAALIPSRVADDAPLGRRLVEMLADVEDPVDARTRAQVLASEAVSHRSWTSDDTSRVPRAEDPLVALVHRALGAFDLEVEAERTQAVGLARTLRVPPPVAVMAQLATTNGRFFADCVRAHAQIPEHAEPLAAVVDAYLRADVERVESFRYNEDTPDVVMTTLTAMAGSVDWKNLDAVEQFLEATGSNRASPSLNEAVKKGFETTRATYPIGGDSEPFLRVVNLAHRFAGIPFDLPEPKIPKRMTFDQALRLADDHYTRDVAERSMIGTLEASTDTDEIANMMRQAKRTLRFSHVIEGAGIKRIAALTDWTDPTSLARFLTHWKQLGEPGLIHEMFETANLDGSASAELLAAMKTHPNLEAIDYQLRMRLSEPPLGDVAVLERVLEESSGHDITPVYKALCAAWDWSVPGALEHLLEVSATHKLSIPADAAEGALSAQWHDAPALRSWLATAIDNAEDPKPLSSVIKAGLARLQKIHEWVDPKTTAFLWTHRAYGVAGRRSTFPREHVGLVLNLHTENINDWTAALGTTNDHFHRDDAKKALTAAIAQTSNVALLEALVPVAAKNYAMKAFVFQRFCEVADATDAEAVTTMCRMSRELHEAIPSATLDRMYGGDPDLALSAALLVRMTGDTDNRTRADETIVRVLQDGSFSDRLARIDHTLDELDRAQAMLRPVFEALKSEIPREDADQHPALQRLGRELYRVQPDLLTDVEDLEPYLGTAHVLEGMTGNRNKDLKAALEAIDGKGMAGMVAQAKVRHMLLDPQQTDEHVMEQELRSVGRGMFHTWRKTLRLQGPASDHFIERVYQPAFDRLCRMIDWSDDARVQSVLGGLEQLAQNNVTITLAPKHLDDLFGHGHTTDLGRASQLKNSKNDVIRQRAEREWSELETKTTLADALTMQHAPNAAIKKMGADIIARGFTAAELKDALLTDTSLDFDQLAARVKSTSDHILGLPKSPETEAMVAQAVKPALDRLCDLTDWKNAAKAKQLGELPVAFSQHDYTLEFPAAHAAALHHTVGPGVASDLILHPTKAVRDVEIRSLRERKDAATDRAGRLALYTQLRATLQKAPRPTPGSTADRDTWKNAVADAIEAIDSPGQSLMDELRTELLDEARHFATTDLPAGLRAVQEVLDSSIERDQILDDVVPDGWNDRAVLESVVGYGNRNFVTARAQLLTESIGTFPGDVANLIAFLDGTTTAATLATSEGLDPSALPSFERLKMFWNEQDRDTQKRVVTKGVQKTLALVEQKDPAIEKVATDRGFATARAMVDQALDERAFDAIRADPDGKKIVGDVREVLDALPVAIRARILATLLLDPPTQDAPVLLKRIMVAAGAVAIKVGQQLCEDPDIPKRFADVIEDVRDQNERMSPLGVWSRIPAAQKGNIAQLGPTIGTGSIKQVLEVRPDSALGFSADDDILVAIVREGVQEDIDGSIAAIDVLPHMRHIGRRVKPMLQRELDLPREANAFKELEQSAVGQLDIVRVPEVIASDHHFLMRKGTGGRTIAQTGRTRVLDAGEKQRLEKLHQYLVRAALDTESGFLQNAKTFVLTDPHDANVSDNGAELGLFDPGQFENLTTTEAELFVQILAAFSRDSWQKKRKASIVDALAKLCDIGDPNDGQNQNIAQRLADAYDGLAPGGIASKLEALFLAASKNGVAIPNSYFGVAKMLNTLRSREQKMGLEPVTENVIQSLYLDQLGPFGRAMKAFV